MMVLSSWQEKLGYRLSFSLIQDIMYLEARSCSCQILYGGGGGGGAPLQSYSHLWAMFE